MTRLMTYFDSKRYISFKKFQDYYNLRKKHFPVISQQEEEYQKMFTRQSVRYTFQVKENWIEETFESMDGNYLTFYHDKIHEEALSLFLQDTLHFYEYAFGGVSSHEQLEEIIIRILTDSEHFTYELDTLVYRKEGVECYLTITLFQGGNFAFKLFEKEEYEDSIKETLLREIKEKLTPLLD